MKSLDMSEYGGIYGRDSLRLASDHHCFKCGLNSVLLECVFS